MDKNRKKELQEQYKSRRVVGGIYRIVNRENGRFYLRSTDDMQAAHNSFSNWSRFGDCSLPPIREDWARYGADAFHLEELDLLEKGEAQTREDFQSDLKTLLALWEEKLPEGNRY